MKKLALLALGALIFGLAGCKKEPIDDGGGAPEKKTELELIVVDDSTNQLVQAAPVELYKTEADRAARNPNKLVQGYKSANTFGRCLYSSLEPITYWFRVESPDFTKNNDSTLKSVTLVKGQKKEQMVRIK